MATSKTVTARSHKPADSATKQGKEAAAEPQRTRDGVAARLRVARDTLGLTQKEVAQRINMPLPSYKDYEAGNRVPGGEALGLLIMAGINANWLITGEGPMLLSEPEPPGISQAPLDWKVLADVIEDVESRMRAQSATLLPEKKAQLIGLAYDYYVSTGKRDATLLDRFLKLVAE